MRKSIRYTLATISTLFALVAGYLWLTFASPYGYNPTGDLPTIEEDTTYSVFVFGTLTKPWVRWLVTGRAGDSEPAKLPGFRKDKLDIKPVAGAVTEGEVIKVNAEELRALDRYERLGVRYERVKLTLDDGSSAWVYRLMDPILVELSEEISD
ncbi:gamma-glutamylcyclotransferase family protein [Marinobacter sp. ATCH36]|uniref:gamma-glutamylcyclotransferase family protein n=1 Tax=Marinobacter sp. ATCH36 TaxID=2945106 RepID=UPI002020023D|nr:gamma-glutamylcyclotransferase family protein [Marinobacter sp. ATCH36]MCL7943730.1 gamma-glutamylcyclotransferase [Marinobacter sp. ATCH36]